MSLCNVCAVTNHYDDVIMMMMLKIELELMMMMMIVVIAVIINNNNKKHTKFKDVCIFFFFWRGREERTFFFFFFKRKEILIRWRCSSSWSLLFCKAVREARNTIQIKGKKVIAQMFLWQAPPPFPTYTLFKLVTLVSDGLFFWRKDSKTDGWRKNAKNNVDFFYWPMNSSSV